MNSTILRQVLHLRTNDPTISASDMARAVGVSREWVRQTLVTLGLSTRKPPLPVRLCPVCQTVIPRKINKFCSTECMSASRRVTLTCLNCKQEFQRRRRLHLRNLEKGYKYIWCSRQCQGQWLGKNRAEQRAK